MEISKTPRPTLLHPCQIGRRAKPYVSFVDRRRRVELTHYVPKHRAEVSA